MNPRMNANGREFLNGSILTCLALPNCVDFEAVEEVYHEREGQINHG